MLNPALTTCRYCGHLDADHEFTSIPDPDGDTLDARVAIYDCRICDWDWCMYIPHNTRAELPRITKTEPVETIAAAIAALPSELLAKFRGAGVTQ